jgi:hypothetical protein
LPRNSCGSWMHVVGFLSLHRNFLSLFEVRKFADVAMPLSDKILTEARCFFA